MTKYRLTNETRMCNGHTLHRIEYTRDWLDSVGLEELEGGWAESELNLDQSGGAWVSGDACVSGDAWVSGNAWVYGNAWVSGGAWVSGDACVSGDAWVSGNACVSGDACVSGNISDDIAISNQAQWEQYNAIRSKYLEQIKTLA